ncbi:hypothetical protein HanXRQr2_Chr10g0455341 [Helianthus annuus]|uniref:Uncharacterized protein n=1 Tax=Helianthus annuus TaxID=4232 RepID=A0A251TMP4_HELAN|nr:hypothetical protein HanXRQr2_Chr10g0455341 [Helianthus annuus]KAJ0514868.1 hypothetical protein HanHA300_Chr10g0374401 [Helianthus annuus]KAJ0531032.1 hypothetical protein HanHA89_Chr10g0396621 [Helianthus annuus]KAJ0884953.1 hypothetical protein HanPSC8_Chr10g0439781 [Helianthus annuus]
MTDGQGGNMVKSTSKAPLIQGEFALERRVILIPEINEVSKFVRRGKTLRQDQQIRLRLADTTFVGPPVQPKPLEEDASL